MVTCAGYARLFVKVIYLLIKLLALLHYELDPYRVLKKLEVIFVITIQHGYPRFVFVGEVVCVIRVVP